MYMGSIALKIWFKLEKYSEKILKTQILFAMLIILTYLCKINIMQYYL